MQEEGFIQFLFVFFLLDGLTVSLCPKLFRQSKLIASYLRGGFGISLLISLCDEVSGKFIPLNMQLAY